MSDLILLPVVLLRLILKQLHPCLNKRVVVAPVVFKLSTLEMDDVCADSVHEIPRVRDDDEDPFVGFEFFFEPDAGVEVEVLWIL